MEEGVKKRVGGFQVQSPLPPPLIPDPSEYSKAFCFLHYLCFYYFFFLFVNFTLFHPNSFFNLTVFIFLSLPFLATYLFNFLCFFFLSPSQCPSFLHFYLTYLFLFFLPSLPSFHPSFTLTITHSFSYQHIHHHEF